LDSVTQFALGAGVGAVVLGRKIGPRKAALVGGVLGTLPDLDVYFPYDNPVDSFTLHRGPSHSLIVHAAVTPVLGEIVRLMFRDLRDCRVLVWVGVYLCLATHALLDALTIYGTRLFWPIWDEPVAIGSVFIIDPLYTVPLLVAMVWALCVSGWTDRFRKTLVAALVVSTAYLGWTMIAQQIVRDRAASIIAGIASTEKLLVTSTPFNSLLWKVVAFDRDSYFNLYLPVFGGRETVEIHRHPRRPSGLSCPDGLGSGLEMFGRLAAFSKGFYRLDRRGDDILLSDLRMGLTPNYVFRFRIATVEGGQMRAAPPVRVSGSRSSKGDFDWLFARLGGAVMARPAEADSSVKLADLPRRQSRSVAVC
jgi:inner membrane protein